MNKIDLRRGGSCLITIERLENFSNGHATLDVGSIKYAFKIYKTKNPKTVFIDVPAMYGNIPSGYHDLMLEIYHENGSKMLNIPFSLEFVDNDSITPNFAILIPAIIDPECNERNVKTIKENIINVNEKIFFKVFVNIDHITQKNSNSSFEDLGKVISLYNQLKTENSKLEISVNNPNLGTTKSIFNLYQKFEKENIQNCLVLDDDQEVMYEIDVEKIFAIQNSILNSAVITLNGTKQTNIDKRKEKGEDVIIPTENLIYKNEEFNMALCRNEKVSSFVSPGSFLTRGHVSNIIKEYRDNIYVNNEDQISNMSWFNKSGSLIYYRYKNKRIMHEPIILDKVRCKRKNEIKKDAQKQLEKEIL